MHYIFILIAFFIPAQAWSAYDVEEVKRNLANNHSFKISGWEQSATDLSWHASTSLKYTAFIVGDKKAQSVFPFVNSTQKNSSKKRCAEFAALTLATSKEKELGIIKELIRQSTTRHQIKFAKFADTTFYVVPKLVGMRVSLHCTVKVK